MPITVVRYHVKDDRADENQALVEGVFAELEYRQPTRLGYTVLRLADGLFVHTVDIDAGADDTGLTGLDSFRRVGEEIADRVTEPPVLQPAVLVGAYNPRRRP